MVIFLNETTKLTSVDCAVFLGLPLIGGNIEVHQVAGLGSKSHGAVMFVSTFNEVYVDELNKTPGNFVIAQHRYSGLLQLPHVISNNPRLDFCRLSKKFFPRTRSPGIEKSAAIGENVSIGKGVYIGHNAVVEDNVKIGDYTIVMHNVVVSEGSEIGNHCLIKSGVVIGQKGFGFERDEEGIPIEFTHYGKVILGNHVEIGANTTIASGALGSTLIKDNVKINDHVHIAHNCIIEYNTLIAGFVNISGSCKIGKNCWISSGSTIKNNIDIGDNCFLGISSTVTQNLASNKKTVSITDLSYRDVIKLKRTFK